MNRNKLLGPRLLGLLACLPVAANAADPPTPLSVYGRLPAVEDVALSPDGSRVAYVQTAGDQRVVTMRALTGDKTPSMVRMGDLKLRAIRWIDDDNLLMMTSSTGTPRGLIATVEGEYSLLQVYTISKHKLSSIDLGVPDELTLNVARMPMIRRVDGVAKFFVPGYFIVNQTMPAMFQVDLNRHSAQIIARSSEPWSRWLMDEAGRVAAEFVYRERSKQWTIRVRKGERLVELASGKAEVLEVPWMEGFSADGSSIVVGFTEDGESVWKALSLADGSWGAPAGENGIYYDALEDRSTGRIMGGVTHQHHYTFFDPKLQEQWDSVAHALSGQRIDLVSYSADFSKFVIRVFGVKNGYDYALFDRATHHLEFFAPVYQGLAAICEKQPVHYAAADGLDISGYLTLPCGKQAKGLPLVVLPHGGPQSEDTDEFDWWGQALASQGYAVLQPNFRGSTLNGKLMVAGYGEWGRKMQTDLSDGVRYLAEQGTIDPSRVCIVGASYGGYAALAGVSLQSGIYRCAVSVAGVSDLRRLLKYTDAKYWGSDFARKHWDHFLGVSVPDDPAVAAISPIEHVSAVNVPVLLIHGKDDTVVPYEQSQVMLEALKHAGKSAELVTLKDEDHWLSRSATRLQMLEASVAFLKANNPPD